MQPEHKEPPILDYRHQPHRQTRGLCRSVFLGFVGLGAVALVADIAAPWIALLQTHLLRSARSLSFFQWANLIEGMFWVVLAIVHMLWSRSHSLGDRSARVLFAFLVAFGISDWVEMFTGAWWRPWWLLAWKAVCVGCFAAMITRYFLIRRAHETAKQA